MTTDVDTLESQVSEQLADLVQSLGNLKTQAEAHGSSSKTLSETAAEIRQMISAIAKTAEAIQASADAVSKVDTAAVLQELQETRANLQTAFTTSAQRADTFQARQQAESEKVVASVETLLTDAKSTKEGLTTASEMIDRLDKTTSRTGQELASSVDSLQKSALSNAAATVDKITELSTQLQKETNDAIGEASSSITDGQSQQLAAINSSEAKNAEMIKQLAAKLGQIEEQNSSQFNKVELAVEKTRERMAEELETRIGSTRALVLAFGIISMLGIFATLGVILFRG
jgi:hypothetical protein